MYIHSVKFLTFNSQISRPLQTNLTSQQGIRDLEACVHSNCWSSRHSLSALWLSVGIQSWSFHGLCTPVNHHKLVVHIWNWKWNLCYIVLIIPKGVRFTASSPTTRQAIHPSILLCWVANYLMAVPASVCGGGRGEVFSSTCLIWCTPRVCSWAASVLNSHWWY